MSTSRKNRAKTARRPSRAQISQAGQKTTRRVLGNNARTRKRSGRVTTWLIVVCVAVLLFAGGLAFFRAQSMLAGNTPAPASATPVVSLSEPAATSTVALINGVPIAFGEFALYLPEEQSRVLSYFHTTYGAVDSANFWTTSFGGTTPLAMLKQQTLQTIEQSKMEQILMQHKGIVSDISYPTFLQSLAQENQRRAEAIQQGQPIYGPQYYEAPTYYDYLQNNRLIALKKQLGTEELAPSDAALQSLYQTTRETDFALPEYLALATITVPRPQGDSSTAQATIQQAWQELQAGTPFATVAHHYNADGQLDEQVFDAQVPAQARLNSRAYQIADALNTGAFSGVESDAASYFLVTCLAKHPGGYVDFTSARSSLVSMYVDAHFDALITGLLHKATIQIQGGVYNAIIPE